MSLLENRPLLIKYAIAALLGLLLVLMVCKPRVDNEFNSAYIDNLSDMQLLTGELLRDHLLVRQGLVKHFDFLEADLELMETTAQLARYVPNYVQKEYLELSTEYLDEYDSSIASIRVQMEKSKRGIGLLNNARAAFRRYLEDLNDLTIALDDPQVKELLNELNHDLVYREADETWLNKLESLGSLSTVAAPFIRPLSLHARMIVAQRRETEQSAKAIYSELEQQVQPDLLKDAFVQQYVDTNMLTDKLLWVSYAAVAALVGLCIILTMSSRKVQEQAQRSAQVAQDAQFAAERRAKETQEAIIQCNEVLAEIAKGDFRRRLEGPFDKELELLRTGINQTADSVEFTMLELTRVMKAIQRGRFDVRLDSRVQGEFGQQVDQTIANLDLTIGDICRVMDEMRNGCFAARVEELCCGRLLELKQSINKSMIVMEEAIEAVVAVAECQSQGDFSQQIRVDGKGQLEHLAHSINATSSKVYDMVQQIRQVSRTVASSSDSMHGNSLQLWEHTNSHSDSVARLLGKVDLVRASIKTNQDSVKQATSLVDRSRQAADKGTMIADEAIGFMDDINEKSQKIATITQVLDTIAGQTNLLALNAAVEAARAREHGSGFSVVANEVKELARQSAEASTHITALIQAATKDIRLGAESVENTGKALQAIAQSINDVERATHTIVEESHQQEEGMDTIVKIVSKSRLVMDSDLKLAESNRETSQSLGELAHRVNELLAFFQASGSGTH